MNDVHASPTPIEFWFEFGSNYSYLSVMRIEEMAKQANVQIIWRPFLLGPIFRDFGWSSSPFVLQAEKGQYVWRDMERRAGKYGLAFRKPSAFPRSAILPMRVAILGANQTWIGAYCKRIMSYNWVEDMEIDIPDVVLSALKDLVPDPQGVIRAAQEDDNKLRLRRQTEKAKELKIFGAPTFFVNGEMFWGDDRLEDALDAARSR